LTGYCHSEERCDEESALPVSNRRLRLNKADPSPAAQDDIRTIGRILSRERFVDFKRMQ
jgi:hypothetical protein